MAGKSAGPLLIGLGAAALLLSGKKKKSSKKLPEVDTHYDVADYLDPESGGMKIVLDQECMEIAHKINPTAHNSYITSRFDQMIAEGATDTDQISLQLLSEQSTHCPWGEPDKWTPMMKGLYDQLSKAVAAYYQLKIEHGQIEG